MNIFTVVLAQLLFFLLRPAAQRFLHIPILILTTNHEPDLAAGVSGNGGIGIFDGRKDLLARGFELDDGEFRRICAFQMQPLAFRCW